MYTAKIEMYHGKDPNDGKFYWFALDTIRNTIARRTCSDHDRSWFNPDNFDAYPWEFAPVSVLGGVNNVKSMTRLWAKTFTA